MSIDTVKGRWHQLSGAIQQKWGEMTHDNATEMEGRFNRFYGQMLERFGTRKDDARRIFDKLSY